MISGGILLRMKNNWIVVERIKTQTLCSISIFRKSSFYEMVWENVVKPTMLNGPCAWRAGYVLLCFEPLISLLYSFMPII